MTIAFRPVVPATDAPLIHDWVTQPRARFWGMLERDLEEVEAIYTYIDEQPHLTAWLASVDETPVAIVQTYDPFVDEIGEFYDRRPGDVGLHLFLADDPARAGHTRALLTDRDAGASHRLRRRGGSCSSPTSATSPRSSC